MLEKKKSLSCPSLHHAVYLAPDELRHCCKRFFVNGKINLDFLGEFKYNIFIEFGNKHKFREKRLCKQET